MNKQMLVVLLVACGGGEDDSDTDLGGGGETDPEAELITEAEFLQQFEERLCAEVAACPDALPCDADTWGDQCQFDAIAAQECLDGRFSCEESVHTNNPNWVEVPAACSDVYSYCR